MKNAASASKPTILGEQSLRVEEKHVALNTQMWTSAIINYIHLCA